MEDSQLNVKKVCACGCGGRIRRKKNRFLYGHNIKFLHKTGVEASHWKTGKSETIQGYVVVWAHNHPNADKDGYILEHRLIMSKKLGRPLKRTEHVHHSNGIKNDNRPENLELVSKGEHNTIHFHKDMSSRICSKCGSNKTQIRNGYSVWFRNPAMKGEYLCRLCHRRMYYY